MNFIFLLFFSLTISGSLLTILLLLFKPLLKNYFSKTWQYYIWIIVIIRLLVPIAPKFNLVGQLFSYNNKIIEDINQTLEQEFSLNKSIQKDTTPVSLNNTIKGNLWIFWIIIAIVLFIHKIISYYQFLHLIKAGRIKVSNSEILNLYQEICTKLKIKNPPVLYRNKLLSSPMLVGIFHPFIVLSQTNLTNQELAYIFEHELIHLKRYDIFYKWLLQLVVSLHWYNPFVYLINYEVNKNCELACDEAVIKQLDKRGKQEYGDTLMTIMKNYSHYTNTFISINLNQNSSLLKDRLEAIIRFSKKSNTAILITILFTITFCLGAAFTGACTTPFQNEREKQRFNKINKKVTEIKHNFPFGISSAAPVSDLKNNNIDKKAITIMDNCGTWGETIEELLPKMTPDGIEKVVTIYLERHCYTKETTKEAFSEIELALTYLSPETVKKLKSIFS